MVLALPAQSVTISKEQLDELIRISQAYEQITLRLAESWETSGKRIDVLESGFEQYKGTVEDELLPKTLALERRVGWLRLGLILSIASSLFLGGVVLAR